MAKSNNLDNNLKEKVIIVGLELRSSEREIEESLDELEQLVLTAGGIVVARVIQLKDKPDPRTYIGKGKVEEIKILAGTKNADIVVFDDDLSASQQRHLEDEFNCRVVDRTTLILDIFAQRAHSNEGKLQVELAQLNYLLPRLVGRGVELSRLGGGIGTRGPGETKLEVDRRRIRTRIGSLRSQLKKVAQTRNIQRKHRKKTSVTCVSLVGYTNAGKSTLLSLLTGADVFVEDKLFATLDSTTRRLALPNQQNILISDTVGFIHKLPHHLVAAFKSTLEEVREADLLLHIIDSSHPAMKDQIKAVYKVLDELESLEKPRIEVFNKIDKITSDELTNLKSQFTNGVFISAKDGVNVKELLERIENSIESRHVETTLLIPYNEGGLIARAHSEGIVLKLEYLDDKVKIKAKIPFNILGDFENYIMTEDRKQTTDRLKNHKVRG
ncbi:MAG: GTPase HflX [Actinobacteria bacterium]|nr:GTPase HflX [Actinomycetota bacterium]